MGDDALFKSVKARQFCCLRVLVERLQAQKELTEKKIENLNNLSLMYVLTKSDSIKKITTAENEWQKKYAVLSKEIDRLKTRKKFLKNKVGYLSFEIQRQNLKTSFWSKIRLLYYNNCYQEQKQNKMVIFLLNVLVRQANNQEKSIGITQLVREEYLRMHNNEEHLLTKMNNMYTKRNQNLSEMLLVLKEKSRIETLQREKEALRQSGYDKLRCKIIYDYYTQENSPYRALIKGLTKISKIMLRQKECLKKSGWSKLRSYAWGFQERETTLREQKSLVLSKFILCKELILLKDENSQIKGKIEAKINQSTRLKKDLEQAENNMKYLNAQIRHSKGKGWSKLRKQFVWNLLEDKDKSLIRMKSVIKHLLTQQTERNKVE